MAFDGNGNWISNFSAVADRDADIKILASRFDGIFIDDIADSFDNCLTRDGQGKPLAPFNANNYRVINVANPTNDKDAINKQYLETYLLSKVPASVGSGIKPVYTDASNVITASSSTVGSSSQPIYMNSGTFTACSNSGIIEKTMPDYSAGVSVSTSSYTAPSNGFFFCYKTYTSRAVRNISVNGVQISLFEGYDGDWAGTCCQICFPVKSGDVITNISGITCKFFPCIGG